MGLETIATVVGLAAAAAGTGVSMKAASDSRKDMNRALEQSLAQNQEFKRQARPIQEESLKGSSRQAVQESINRGALAAREGYEKTSLLPGQPSALPVDQNRVAGVVGQARDAAAEQQGLIDSSYAQQFKDQEAAKNLGVISNLAGASAGAAPILAQLAGNKSASVAGIGSLLTTAGNLSAIYGGIQSRRAPTAVAPKGPQSYNEAVSSFGKN